MSVYYKSQLDQRYLYKPKQEKPYAISRSKIDLFLECPRCFYLDRRIGIRRPPGFPFNLNSAVDALLKKEFDHYRNLAEPHPLMTLEGIDAIPFAHPKIDYWRDALKGGVSYVEPKTNLKITGGVDDVWVNPQGELIVVDYKSTAKQGEVNIDADWQISYKRQLEVYMWLFSKNGFKVASTGYFVYCNANVNADVFDKRLDFSISVLPYRGDFAWVNGTILDLYTCLNQETVPEPTLECDYCQYQEAINRITVSL